MVLSDYLTATQRLLHDANSRFWSVTELTDYINEGRSRITTDTGCLRSPTEAVSVLTGVDSYNLGSMTSKTTRAVDILNFTLIWGDQRIPLLYSAWTKFSADLRLWVNNTTRPCVWTRVGMSPGLIYLAPVPDQNYSAEADIIYTPIPLVTNADVDELAYPFNIAVAFYAAYKAKLKEQAYGEADFFLKEYARKGMEAVNAVYTRRLPNPYS